MPRDPSYDLLLNGAGLMLARRAQMGRGGRAWQVQTVGASIAQRTPGEMLYGNQEATIEIPMVWRTAHLGYGDEIQRGEGRYRYTVNVDARFPEQIIPGPHVETLTIGGSANVNGFFEHDGDLFCIAGRYCKKIASDDSVSEDKDFGSGKVAMDVAIFNDVVYVGMGYSVAFWQRTATPTWSQASGLYMGHIAVFKDRAWASTSQYQTRSFAITPTVGANWGAPYNIGDPGTAITAMAQLGELLYVGKADGLYALGASGLAQSLTPELAAFRNSDNCLNMAGWHGSMWVPHIRGLLNYRNLGAQGFMVTPATPGQDVDEDNPVRGQITALAGDNRWLYAALYTAGGDTYIMAGRVAQGQEQVFGALIWHPLAKIASKKCEAMHISGLWTNPRLFFGLGVDVAYIILPRHSDNPIQDSACRYSLTGSIYFPAHSWGTPTTVKIWKSVEIMGDLLSSARYVNIYYRVDGGSWVLAGKAAFPQRHIIALAEEGVTGSKIELRLDITIPNSAAPLLIRSVVVRGVERPQTIELITAVVRCADNLPLRGQRGKCHRSGATILSELKALAKGDDAVTLTDVVGTERQVLVLPPIQESEVQQEGDLPREVLATIRMAEFEVDETDLPEAAYFVWDVSKWDGGDVWR